MQNAKISTNYDTPEAAMEGLLQTAVCDLIGWTTDSSVFKTIVVMTDAITKCAGDGRIVAITEPHDGLCHVDDNAKYPEGLDLDYPSIGLVGDILRKKQISVIFAISGEDIYQYKEIIKSWKGVSGIVTELSSGASNIISIINTSRKVI
ncbi:hypothetical protein HZS_1195 [Henneguya salminicola]|nr:hypothetical protein HZS_1195 [Henneguya salminicola]